MRSRTWALNSSLFVFLCTFLLAFAGGNVLFANQAYSLVVTAGSQTYIYNNQLAEVANYRSDLRQFTVQQQTSQASQPSTSRTLEKLLPPVWTISPSGTALFGVDPETQHIVNISLTDFEKTPLILKPSNLKLFHILNATRWLTALPNTTKYFTIASYDINTHATQPLYKTTRQITEAFYDPLSAQLASFEFEEKSEYTDILYQLYHLKRVGFLSILNIKDQKKQSFPGSYPTHNSLLREIIYFDQGQAMCYSFQHKRKSVLPLKFTPLYTPTGEWMSAPKLLRLPSGSFILWLKKDDGTYQLLEYTKDGQPSKILLANQSGPVNLQLVRALPQKFLEGNF